jgi:hypothetical protein
MVLLMHFGLWVKLRISLIGATPDESVGLYSWHAMDAGYIPFNVVPWLTVHVLVLLARRISFGGIARSWSSNLFVSLVAAVMCISIIFALWILLWEPHRTLRQVWALLVVGNVILPVAATTYCAIRLVDGSFAGRDLRRSTG